MSIESFKCPNCKKFTRHISVGMQGGLNGELRWRKDTRTASKLFANVVGGLSDYTGLTKLMGTIAGKETYKCCECGMVAMWNKDGTIDCTMYDPRHKPLT